MRLKSLIVKIPWFYVGYVLYFVAFFLSDMAFDADRITKDVRYIAYLCFGVCGLVNSKTILHNLTNNPKKIVSLSIMFLLGLSVVVFRYSFYWIITLLIIIVVSSIDVSVSIVVKTSYKLVLALTLLTLVLLMVGVLPNVITARGGVGENRYGMGFYHSNVLPMVLFYVMVYRMLLLDKTKRMRWHELTVWIILAVVIYVICDSRIGFYGTVFCAFLYAAAQQIKLNSFPHKVLVFFSKWSALLCAVFSIVMMLLQGVSASFVHQINGLFSGRFGIAFAQMKITGLGIIGLSPVKNFAVLDNGYLYTALRYGLLFVVFYVVLQFKLVNKYRDNIAVLVTSLCVMIACIIDNDFYSFGFLPFLILAFAPVEFSQNRPIESVTETQIGEIGDHDSQYKVQ